MTVNFNKYNVSCNGLKARVHYSHGKLIDGRTAVTIYAKDYGSDLGKIFSDAYENNTDIQTDYFEKGLVRLFEDHPLYAAARARATAK